MSEQIYYNSDESVPFNNALVNATTVNATTVNTSNVNASNVNFGQSNLNFYKTTNTISLVMSDGTNAYAQAVQLERIGNIVKLTLRNIPVSPVANGIFSINSTGFIPAEWRPSNNSTFINWGTFPGAVNGGSLRFDVTSAGNVQIRKTDSTAFAAGNISYNDINLVYSFI
jgi:hypothetical protein